MADLMSVLEANSRAPQGWASVGQALAGLGGAGREDAYNRGLAKAAQLDQLVQTARYSREKAMEAEDARKGRGGFAPAAIAAGIPEAQAGLLSNALMAGYDPTKVSGYLGQSQEQGFREGAVARSLAGDFGGGNAYLMGVANGPVELASVQGQNLINNRLLEGGGGVTSTEQGRAAAAADAARAASAYASANSSNATAQATRARLGIAQAQFDLQRQGRWNPDGKVSAGNGSTGPSAGADGGMLSDLNPRQKTGAQSVQRNLLSYAAALTGTPESELRKLSADEIAKLMEQEGGRTFQGGLARFARNLPGGQTLGDVLNSDILSYSQGAGAGLAAYENPSGPISNADRETSTLQMPTYLDPVRVQANKTRNFLNSTGYQPTAAEAFGGVGGSLPPNSRIQPNVAPAAAAPLQRARNPATGEVVVLRNGQWVPE